MQKAKNNEQPSITPKESVDYLTDSLQREAVVEEELYHLIRVVLEKHEYLFHGVKFGRIQPQHPVNGGIADLVLSFADGKHALVIECKRKVVGKEPLRDFDVFGSNVLNQTINYASRLGTPAFATTNGSRLALFRKPRTDEPFRIDTCRLFIIDPFKLEESYVEKLLDFLSKWYSGKPVKLVEIDWFFISRLRSFVDFLSKSYVPVIKQLLTNEDTLKRFQDFSSKVGGLTTRHLARETAYLLMNKIVFYKILERYYHDIAKLKALTAPDGKYFMQFLKGYFDKAIFITGDFEPIFITEFYDDIPLSNIDYVLEEVNSFIEEMDTYKLEEVGSDVVGYIYEELLPDEERHTLGQFYTPPPIAEFIVKWAVREPSDLVLDPAVGSGTFMVKAYQRLCDLKSSKHSSDRRSASFHKEVLSQLYADDINPFPAHLTAMNLAMRNVLHPTSEMNIVAEDFFNLRPKTPVFTPFVVKTPEGEKRRQIMIPTFDAIVANPPYTRWIEISEPTIESINKSLKETLKKYGLTSNLRSATSEAGIYIHFIMHAKNFLPQDGRLGMIISNSWLQSDYGVKFADFLLDNFRIKAVIDFSNRLFRLPMISTCILLLERCAEEKERLKNKTVFVFVDKEIAVEHLLDLVNNPDHYHGDTLVRVVNQKNIPRNRKWIQILFATDAIEESILQSGKIVSAHEEFNVYRGNTVWAKHAYEKSLRPNLGPKEFFYLNKDKMEQRNLKDYTYPALTNVRYNKFLTFTKSDWKKIEEESGNCYFFMCRKSRANLPKDVRDYVKWGESDCKTKVRSSRRGGKVCSKSWVCEYRERTKKVFFDWYDLGGVVNAPLFAVYHNRYKPRFVLTGFPIALYHATIAFVPKKKIDSQDLKAIAAYLNSTLIQLYVETHGRVVSVGPIALELNQSSKIPLLNLKKLTTKEREKLADLFDRLESKARIVGGIQKRKSLSPLFDELDLCITEILKLEPVTMKSAKRIAEALMERRLSGARLAKPESVMGDDIPTIRPPTKTAKKITASSMDKKITRWIE